MKEYFLKYKTNCGSIDEVKTFLVHLFDFDFEKRESDYIGVYYLYKGLYADRLRIFKSNDEILIEVDFNSGKSKDRKSRYLFIKKSFNNHSKYFEILNDREEDV